MDELFVHGVTQDEVTRACSSEMTNPSVSLLSVIYEAINKGFGT